MGSVVYDLLRETDLEAAIAIEHAGFSPEEAGSLQAFRYRQAEAGELFLGAYTSNDTGRTLVGYVCSTLSPASSLTHASMSQHVPSSSSVCIHSVCVSLEYRRKGIAVGLLQEYIARLKKAQKEGAPYTRVLLITHEELVPLYEKAGFEYVGESAVVHGPRSWFEMRKVLSPGTEIESSLLTDIATRADLGALLQQSISSNNRPQAKLLSSFAGGVQEVTEGSDEARNKFDLLCPRNGCGSVILKKGVAAFVERESALLEPRGQQGANPHLVVLPEPPMVTQWWRITPSPMAFENIGFSRPTGELLSPAGKKMKLLLCADCEVGPLGWCEEGGREFWLHTSRVGYLA